MGAIRSHKPKNKSLSCKNNFKISSPNSKLPVSKIRSSLLTSRKIKSKPMPKKLSAKPNNVSATSSETKPTNSEPIASQISTVSSHCWMKPPLPWTKSPKTI
jgi:hypothetical protein